MHAWRVQWQGAEVTVRVLGSTETIGKLGISLKYQCCLGGTLAAK